MAHDAEYFRQRRRMHGVPERGSFDTPHFIARGRYLAQLLDYPQRTPDLPWPKDLYDDSRSVKAPAIVQGPANTKPEDYCACGCSSLHRNNVSYTKRTAYGGWRVYYFVDNRHKSRYIREQNGRGASLSP